MLRIDLQECNQSKARLREWVERQQRIDSESK